MAQHLRFSHVLTKKNFETWLARSASNKYFTPLRADLDPIAKFLKAKGYKKAVVGNDIIRVTTLDDRVRTFKTPKWASTFIDTFDTSFLDSQTVRGSRITATLFNKHKK